MSSHVDFTCPLPEHDCAWVSLGYDLAAAPIGPAAGGGLVAPPNLDPRESLKGSLTKLNQINAGRI